MNTAFFKVDPRLEQLSDKAEQTAAVAFAEIERITEFNQQKVLSAYIRHRVSETHFNPTTGYGYGDQGRDALDEILADIMGAEDALNLKMGVAGYGNGLGIVVVAVSVGGKIGVCGDIKVF